MQVHLKLKRPLWPDDTRITTEELQAHNNLIEVHANRPVTITHTDGMVETITFKPNSSLLRSASNRLTVTRSFWTPLYHAYIDLWADGNWSNRSVSLTDCGYTFTGACVELTEHSERSTVSSASNNNHAKARATGTFNAILVGVGSTIQTINYDFELWADPADSTHAYIQINDDN